MSRWAVAYVFPFFMIPMWFTRLVLLFKRGSIADKVAFNAWIDREWDRSTQTALGVYPEGHRSTTGKSLPLKRGMLHYAFDRKIPVQVVIGGNKESILSEKKMVVGFGRTVRVGYSEVVFPDKYSDFEAFMADVQSTWDAEWREVMLADNSALEELEEPVPYRDVDPANFFKLLFICPLEAAAFVQLMKWCVFRSVGGIQRVCGTWDSTVLGLLGCWIVASFVYAAKWDDSDERRGRERKRR